MYMLTERENWHAAQLLRSITKGIILSSNRYQHTHIPSMLELKVPFSFVRTSFACFCTVQICLVVFGLMRNFIGVALTSTGPTTAVIVNSMMCKMRMNMTECHDHVHVPCIAAGARRRRPRPQQAVCGARRLPRCGSAGTYLLREEAPKLLVPKAVKKKRFPSSSVSSQTEIPYTFEA